jgi:hypothetical protein
MTKDASDLFLSEVRQYSVGFVIPGPPAPSVLGSGVLAKIDELEGILTCAHVAVQYANRTEIGLVGFLRDQDQRLRIPLGGTKTFNLGETPWTENGYDLAFTALPPNVVSTLKAKWSFLNLARNSAKFYAGEPAHNRHADAILGLIHVWSGEPIVGDGFVTTPMRALLNTGHIVSRRDGGMLTFETMEDNTSELPSRVNGSSGAGVWRLYLNEDQTGNYELVEMRILGIASWQIDKTHLACQGIDRIEQALIPNIRNMVHSARGPAA